VSQTAKESHLILEDVVRALTDTDGLVGAQADVLREQMQRAADEFDAHTAQAFARGLLDALCETPQDLRRLEALLILGLAHPTILKDNRIPLEVEARRLAILLERAGEQDRARCILEVVAARSESAGEIEQDLSEMMRRTGSSAQLIERYLTRSEECVQAGRSAEAIHWLQQVLVLDPERRDVARMIRDLRFQDSERKARNRRRLRLAAFVLAISGLMAAVILRELHLERSYQALPEAIEGDLRSYEARIAELDDLLRSNRLWIGGFRALNERASLEFALDSLRSREARVAHESDSRHDVRLDAAEDARVLGMQAAREGRMEEALAHLRRALSFAPPGWEHRARVETDVAAIEAWRREAR
jgi:tetratricopeptide (TPR) repeat protein